MDIGDLSNDIAAMTPRIDTKVQWSSAG